MIGLTLFNLQETIWERRYLMKTIADEHRLGSSADLGINILNKFSDEIDADFTMLNGEGYTSLQIDNIFKYSIGSTVRFPDNFTSRIVYDIMHNQVSESTFLFFSSYDFNGKFNIAGEFINKQNSLWQYDIIESNIPEGSSQPWRLARDGTALITGIQYSPIKKIKMALNYHDWYPLAVNLDGGAFIYLDL